MNRFLLVLLIVAHTSAMQIKKEDKCASVPAICGNLPSSNYTKMRLPNMFNHSRFEDVEKDIGIWLPLLPSTVCNAGDQLRYFLCFTYAPVCVDKLISPCKSLCETVRDSCDPVMRQNSNYSWPSFFNCNQQRRFPDDSSQMCINLKMLDLQCSCKESYTKQTLKTLICKSDFVFSAWVTRKSRHNDRIEVKPSRIFLQKSSVVLNAKGSVRLEVSHNENHCRCNRLRVKKRARGGGRYLIIGDKVGGKMEVTALKRMEDRHEISKMVKQCKNNN